MPVVNLKKDNFENEVIHSDKPVLIDFFATWCNPCKTVSEIIDRLAEEKTEYKFCKVDVDQQPELTRQFNISSIPTLAVFKQGKCVFSQVGAKSKSDILNMLNK